MTSEDLKDLQAEMNGVYKLLEENVLPSCSNSDIKIRELSERTDTVRDMTNILRRDLDTAKVDWRDSHADMIRQNLESIQTLIQYQDEHAKRVDSLMDRLDYLERQLGLRMPGH
jgi:predicted RNase H-like nuclease (RuvC/YqgF family)